LQQLVLELKRELGLGQVLEQQLEQQLEQLLEQLLELKPLEPQQVWLRQPMG